MMADIHENTAYELWQLLQRGDLDPCDVTEHYLERIERLNPELGAFVTVTADAARDRARHVDAEVARTAPLWGLPAGDKDLSQRAGVPTAFGSRLFQNFVPVESDPIVHAMDAAGAVSLGKTATPEFGLPSYTESRAGPPARNPWDTRLGPGGSSGGAAVAVASGMLPFAPGSDGGGSVRIPAAACGLVGVKPSRGRVGAQSGLDSPGGLVTAGPLARTVADAALLLDGMVAPEGYPVRHPFAVHAPGDDGPFLGHAVRGEGRFQLGVLTDTPWDDAYDITIGTDALDALQRGVDLADRLGHGVEAIALERDGNAYADAFRVLWQVGAASIPAESEEEFELLEPLTRWLVERGRAIPARRFSEALAALTAFERSLIRQLSRFDAVLTPALAMTPRPIGWWDADDGERNFAQQVQYTPFTSMLNVSGLPALTVPLHETAEGLPMGVQVIGRPGGEATLFALAAQLERADPWLQRHPSVW